MVPQVLGFPLTKIIWALGVLWGIVMFRWGLGGWFTIPARELVWGILGVIFGYLIVLPITIMAYWRPKMAAICLSISFLILETAVAATAGLRVSLLGGLLLLAPTVILIFGYMYMASVGTESVGTEPSTDSDA